MRVIFKNQKHVVLRKRLSYILGFTFGLTMWCLIVGEEFDMTFLVARGCTIATG